MRATCAIALAVLVGSTACAAGDSKPHSARPRVTSTTAGAVTTTPVSGASSSGVSSSATSTSATSPPATSLPAGTDSAVTRVVDGDTIVVSDDVTVRLIGIDTPETKDPRKPVQCFGEEAARRTAELLPKGTRVRLVSDVEPTDRYGRTLAYVYRRDDGLFVNAALVRDGYASAYTYPPDVAHADDFVALQREARDQNRGLWGVCGGPGMPATSGSSTSAAPTSTSVTASAGARCDPAYPDVCIPPPPPDLDCKDVPYHRFRVLAPDLHHFDRDRNGIGCES